MSTFKFDKSFQQRLDEFALILEEDGDDVVLQWKTFMEGSIEPAGYSAIWKLSKADCEKNEVRFPCEVYGVVQQTIFDDSVVLFLVESVEDDSVHLPEVCRVPFEDIFPCQEQENSALNVGITADCFDRYRFFFTYIFYPWDSNEPELVKKELQPRMQLFFDLKNKNLSKGLSSHIRRIIAEAKYIQSKRDNFELSMKLSDADIDISHGGSKDVARNLLELHLKLMKIKHEVEILLNPEMREIYEEVKFPHHAIAKSHEPNIFAITNQSTMGEMKKLLEDLSKKITTDVKVHWMSLHDALAAASASSEIYIPVGSHTVNFLEFLNDNIFLSGLKVIPTEGGVPEDSFAELSSEEASAFMFAIDGDFRMENLIIDCRNVKTGFLIKDGKVEIKNCVFKGSKESSVTEGFAISGTAEVTLENCLISNFATGITANEASKVNVLSSVISNCNNGILIDKESLVSMKESTVRNCSDSAVLKFSPDEINKSVLIDESDEKETEKFNISLIGKANKFSDNKRNIVICPKSTESFAESYESDTTMEM